MLGFLGSERGLNTGVKELLRRIMTQAFLTCAIVSSQLLAFGPLKQRSTSVTDFRINNFKRKYQVDSVNVRFNESDTELLKVSRHLPGEVMDLVKSLYREFVLDRMSYLHRSTALWMNNVFEEGEDGPVYIAVAYDSDEPKAYVAYTLRAGKVNDGAPSRNKNIGFRMADEPGLSFNLAILGPSRSRRTHHLGNCPNRRPGLRNVSGTSSSAYRRSRGAWFRVIDVPAALENRDISKREIVIEVFGDDIADWNNGKWKLEVSQGQAVAQSTKESLT